MAGRIPRDFIDDLISRADIVDIVDARVKLKKAGKNHQACCPFHNEKSPSFSVSQEKQFYYCFGCGAKGNVISFLMEFDRLEFPEAIEELASIYGLEVPREKGNFTQTTPEQKSQREQDYALMESVTRFFQHQLKHHAQSASVVDYLKSRGLTGDIVKAWDIGFAPPEWDAVLKTFGADEHKQSRLLELKLINENDNKKRFDFFRNRVMFPIRDKRGRVVGFGGRVMQDDGPKYLNSPETPIFHKGYELFGLYQARQANRKLEQVLVVEGYMDVVALSQFGIDYAVAALGTATTPEHVQMLFKSTPQVICCYDGDKAGRTAAWRALENALPYLKDGCIMKFMFLPDGEDPDTMVRQIGKEKFEALYQDAQPLSKFFFENLLSQHDVSSIEGKAALRSQAKPLIEKISGENQKELLLNELAKICGDAQAINDGPTSSGMQQRKPFEQDFKKPKLQATPVRALLKILINHPSFASQYPEVKIQSIKHLNIKGIGVLVEVHEYCQQNPDSNAARVLEAFRSHPHVKHIEAVAVSDIFEDVDLVREYFDSFKSLISAHINARLEALKAKSRFSALSPTEEQELSLLLQKQMKAKHQS
jgi:DNA primase